MDLKKPLAILLFIFCSFPYISLINTPFDTQPYALLLAVPIIFLTVTLQSKVPYSKSIILFGIFPVYATLIFILGDLSLEGLRSLFGYFSVFLIAFAGFLTFKYIKSSHLTFVIIVWFIFGLIQLVIGKSFGSFILPRLSTSEGRGITSLAVEPSFYAVMCVFFLLFNDYFKATKTISKKMYILNFILLVTQIALTQAGLGYLLFIIYIVVKAITKSNLKQFIISSFATLMALTAFIIMTLNVPSLLMTRAGSLAYLLVTNPIQILKSDGSITDRLSHILVSFLSVFENYGLGFGYGTWKENSFAVIGQQYEFIRELAAVNFSLGGRVMSGLGSAIYELGIVGALFILLYLSIVIKGYINTQGETRSFILFSGITVFFIMINAVPLSFPMFGYFIAVLVYASKSYIRNKQV